MSFSFKKYVHKNISDITFKGFENKKFQQIFRWSELIRFISE